LDYPEATGFAQPDERMMNEAAVLLILSEIMRLLHLSSKGLLTSLRESADSFLPPNILSGMQVLDKVGWFGKVVVVDFLERLASELLPSFFEVPNHVQFTHVLSCLSHLWDTILPKALQVTAHQKVNNPFISAFIALGVKGRGLLLLGNSEKDAIGLKSGLESLRSTSPSGACAEFLAAVELMRNTLEGCALVDSNLLLARLLSVILFPIGLPFNRASRFWLNFFLNQRIQTIAFSAWSQLMNTHRCFHFKT